MSKLIFPDNFLWGTATSGYQIEGNNNNTDWWYEELTKKQGQKYPLEPSGIACDSYNRYQEDIDLAVSANNSCIRIGVEWARLEPQEGVWDQNEFDHYKKVLQYAKSKGLKTFVTLHHFTNPIWLYKKGGWLNPVVASLFGRYAKKCTEELGDLMDFVSPINEILVFAFESYLVGEWPPFKKNILYSILVIINMIRGNNSAYKEIKKVDPQKQTGIINNIAWFKPHKESKIYSIDWLAAKLSYSVNVDLMHLLLKFDYIGVNYYFTKVIKHFKEFVPPETKSDVNSWMDSDGLEKILVDLKRYNKPIYITENGTADKTDEKRQVFLVKWLHSVYNAIQQGSPVKGYMHWSLIDNYEWHNGYWPRFGLIEIDRENNLQRKPRKSYYLYSKICKEKSIEIN